MIRLAFAGKGGPNVTPGFLREFAFWQNGLIRLAKAIPPSPMPKRLRNWRRFTPSSGSGPVQRGIFIRCLEIKKSPHPGLLHKGEKEKTRKEMFGSNIAHALADFLSPL